MSYPAATTHQLPHIPRAPRLPTPLPPALAGLTPMQVTLAHWGRLDAEMANYIGDMITTTLLEARADRTSVTTRPAHSVPR